MAERQGPYPLPSSKAGPAISYGPQGAPQQVVPATQIAASTAAGSGGNPMDDMQIDVATQPRVLVEAPTRATTRQENRAAWYGGYLVLPHR